MNKTAYKKLVRERIRTRYEPEFESWLDKVHSFTKIAAGNTSEIRESFSDSLTFQSDKDKTELDSATFRRPVDPRDHMAGMSNLIQQNLNTLARQVAFKTPDIQVEGVGSEESAIHSEYLALRMGPHPYGCNAAAEMEKAFYACMTSGIGWIGLYFDRGRLGVRHFRQADVNWDKTAHNIGSCEWISIIRQERLSYWLEMFPDSKAKFAEYIEDDDPECYNRMVAVEFYYDTFGENGHAAIYVCSGTEIDEECEIEYGDNPFFYEVGGQRDPFLPVEPMVFAHVPGTIYPTGLVELMIPHQLALWLNEQRKIDLLQIGKPKIIVNEKAFTAETKRQFMQEGILPEHLAVGEGVDPSSAIHVVHGLDLPSGLMEDESRNERRLSAMSGVNGYASGAPVAGVQFAAEAGAIQAQGDLTSSNLAAMYSRTWSNILQKYLAAAVQYDDAPIRIRFDGIVLEFGPNTSKGNMPIGYFLHPEAQIIVQAASHQFETEAQKLARAQTVFQASLTVAQAHPNAVSRAFEEVLKACGIRNTSPYLEVPQASPMFEGSGAAPETAVQEVV